VTPAEREHLLERSYAAFNAGAHAQFPELWTDDLVWSLEGEAAWPGPREYRGYDGLRRFHEDWFGAWDEPRVTRTWTRHLPGDRSLVEAHTTGSLHGHAFELDVWQIVTFRDGRIAGAVHFFDEQAARAAAGVA
jgi:ketosteroid isomerase-like protein